MGSFDYGQRHDQGQSYDSGSSTSIAPGKRARTDGMKGPSARDRLGNLTLLYNQTRKAVKDLLAEKDSANARALAGAVRTMMLAAESLFTQLATMHKSAEIIAQVSELEEEFDALEAKAIPLMAEHGMAPKTGAAIVDEGFGCEHTEQDGCYLNSEQRERVWTSLNAVVGSSMDNYRDAILNVQLDELTAKDPSSWGFLAEFLFYSVTGPLIAAALKGLKGARAAAAAARDSNRFWQEQGSTVMYSTAFEKALGKVKDEQISAVLQNASRGLRAHLKVHASGPKDVSFLRVIQDKIKMLSDSIMLEAPAQLSDVGLVALMRSYQDADAHSVSNYENQVRDMLVRFKSQGLASLNETFGDGGKRTAIILVAYGQRRTAVLDLHGTKSTRTTYDRTSWGGGVHGEKNEGDGIAKLQTVVDPDLAQLAQEISAGGEKEYDLSHLADEDSAPWELKSRDDALGNDPFKIPSWWRDELKAWAIQAKQAQADQGTVSPKPVVAHIPEDDPRRSGEP